MSDRGYFIGAAMLVIIGMEAISLHDLSKANAAWRGDYERALVSNRECIESLRVVTAAASKLQPSAAQPPRMCVCVAETTRGVCAVTFIGDDGSVHVTTDDMHPPRAVRCSPDFGESVAFTWSSSRGP
jgi:hypothetical protein